MTAMRLKRYPSPSGGFALGKMGVGARMMHVKTARDYVQDGLIAMWDGIENAGWGVHDANATTWKDLVGSYDMTLTSLGSFGDNKFINAAGGIGASCAGNITSEGTLEVVCKATSWYKYATTYYVCIGPMMFFGQRNAIANGNRFDGNNFAILDNGNVGINILRSWSLMHPKNKIGTIFVNGVSQPVHLISVLGAEAAPISVNATTYATDFYCIRAYNRALTAAEIAANYAIDKERFNLP